MSRLRWPDSTNSVSEKPGTIHSLAANIDMPRIKIYTCSDARLRSAHMAPKVFFISMAARELGMHPQTLRKYERLGLVRPTRTVGSMRMYTVEELDRLRVIKRLVDELGINLAGVQQILSAAEVVERMRPLVDDSDDATELSGRQRALRREMDRLTRLLGF